jgi:hypothetical protein
MMVFGDKSNSQENMIPVLHAAFKNCGRNVDIFSPAL